MITYFFTSLLEVLHAFWKLLKELCHIPLGNDEVSVKFKFHSQVHWEVWLTLSIFPKKIFLSC